MLCGFYKNSLALGEGEGCGKNFKFKSTWKCHIFLFLLESHIYILKVGRGSEIKNNFLSIETNICQAVLTREEQHRGGTHENTGERQKSPNLE